jgi:hypothetical protein
MEYTPMRLKLTVGLTVPIAQDKLISRKKLVWALFKIAHKNFSFSAQG